MADHSAQIPPLPGQAPAPVPAPASSPKSTMDRDFIARNQIVERYFAGQLPMRGVVDFERYCQEHPEILDELKVAARVQAGLKLMVAGGMPLPWEERPKKPWEHLQVFIGVAVLALALGVLSLSQHFSLNAVRARATGLAAVVAERPIPPITSTRTIVINPSRNAPGTDSALTIGGTAAELADLKVKVEWSAYALFRVTVDRLGQGRVMVIGNLQRDSNGQLRVGINSAALGPGKYQFTIEGLALNGVATPQAWFTLTVAQ